MNKFCIFPIQRPKYWELYKKQLKAIWTTEEIDFSVDYKDFIELDLDKQHSIKTILAFFANSDGLVNFNIQNNLLNNDKEISCAYVFQMFMENIHNETYSLMIETLIRDDNEKAILFDSINNIDIIKKISEWGLKYSSGPYTLSEKILVFICFEGIMFSGAFAFIYWLKNVIFAGSNKMSGLVKSNELISRDEGMHTDFGIEMFNDLQEIEKTPYDNIYNIITECVELTLNFNSEVIRVKQTGMNEELMNEYIKYIADRILVNIGYKKIYNAKNNLLYMQTIGMPQKTNFHESRPTEYQKAGNYQPFNLIDEF
jgi:ribonucleoside-diphosphate reductase beta chain